MENGSAGMHEGPSGGVRGPGSGESPAELGADDQTPASRVGSMLQRIAAAADLETTLSLREDEQSLVAEFVGEGAQFLLADHGRTLDAIQHLAYRMAFGASTPRKAVVVDAAGYRARRATALRAAADQAVETAVREGRPVALEPMSAIERKVVHEHLRDRRQIETYSEGEEPSRRLVVTPLVDSRRG